LEIEQTRVEEETSHKRGKSKNVRRKPDNVYPAVTKHFVTACYTNLAMVCCHGCLDAGPVHLLSYNYPATKIDLTNECLLLAAT